MGNTLENKAKFFAIYWGQTIYQNSKSDLPNVYCVCDLSLKKPFVMDGHLLLTPLSQITDEDALKLSEEVYQSVNEYGFNFYYGGYKSLTSEDVDYLRSKGYALPWMGLSVEQLVSSGWIKLKYGIIHYNKKGS